MDEGDPESQTPRKRVRSPSVDPQSVRDNNSDNSNRPSKKPRLRKEVPAYDAPVDEHIQKTMARSNPLSRKVLKQEARRARRAASRIMKAKVDGGGMEVDDGGLEFTFMA